MAKTRKKMISVTVPWSLYYEMKEIADQDGASVNQFICLAVAKEVQRQKDKINKQQKGTDD